MSPRQIRRQPEKKDRPVKGILKQRQPPKETKRQRRLRKAREKRDDRLARAEGDRIRAKVRSHSIGWFMYACTSVLHAHTIARIFEPQAGRDSMEENDTDSGYETDDSEEGDARRTGAAPGGSHSQQSGNKEGEPAKKRRRCCDAKRKAPPKRRQATSRSKRQK